MKPVENGNEMIAEWLRIKWLNKWLVMRCLFFIKWVLFNLIIE